MTKLETYAVPFTAYEDYDLTADHNFIAIWEIERRNWNWVPQDYATAKGRACNYELVTVPEFTITSIAIFHGGCIASALHHEEDVVGSVEFTGELTISQFKAMVQEMVSDDYYSKRLEPESWESFYNSCKFGQLVNLTSPFSAYDESAA